MRKTTSLHIYRKSMQNILLVLLGPTGVGKTNLSIEIASRLGCEIISCDSRQFYREMSIGTAVPSPIQMGAVKHHFIGFKSINEYYSASLFERDVIELLPVLFIAGRTVIMTGGSGMYIDAVCKGFDDIPDTDPEIREKIIRRYREEGIESLRVSLRMLDPDHYRVVDLRNAKRIIRALEICETTGRPYSSFIKNKRTERDFRTVKIGLNRSREELFGMINQRVDSMIGLGLEEEAMSLYESRYLNALNTVGYREFFDFFEGRLTKEKAVELIKRNTRRYAKRQMTWWARDKEITWFHPDRKQEILDFIKKEIEE